MTLNVIVNNIVAVDSQVSFGQRTSDDVDKSEVFTAEKYHAIIIGNGSGLDLGKGQSFVRHHSAEDIDSFMQLLCNYQSEIQQTRREEYENEKQREITTKYRVVEDSTKKQELIVREFTSAMDALNEGLNHDQPKGALFVIAYDKKIKEVRKFRLPNCYNAKVTDMQVIPVLCDGSGGDLAGAYLVTQTSGINWKKINREQNIYLTALACAVATGNEGVGGFMQIAEVNKDKISYLNEEKVNASVKICSKQVAGVISKQDAMKYVSSILENNPDYANIAQDLDITENDLIYAPTNLHQDVAKFNRLFQKNNPH